MTTTYISDREIDAENRQRCGTSWNECLMLVGPGPEGVCCRSCHLIATHNQDAARQAEAERRQATNFDLWK